MDKGSLARGAIAVEYGDALSRRHIVWLILLCYILYEPRMRCLWPVIPAEKRIHGHLPAGMKTGNRTMTSEIAASISFIEFFLLFWLSGLGRSTAKIMELSGQDHRLLLPLGQRHEL
jgi:hypothetical protein